MNEKELREIKRRIRPDRNNIPAITGCFVNENKTIITKFNQSMTLGESETCEKLLSIMKKVLSGSIGTNLINIEFSTKQVLESEEHKLLSDLRASHLKDADVLDKFYERVINAVNLESNYLILLANDVYDVVTRHKDGEEGESTSVFSYVVCAICPVKNVDEGICFRESDNLFHAISSTAVLSRPELGFMFPAFTDRATDIYHALYYTKSIENNHPAFIEGIFAAEPPMPPKAQKATFSDCLAGALREECDFEVIRSVHAQISDMVEAHKLAKEEEPLTLSASTLKNVLECCGVDEERVEKFREEFDEGFGKNAEVSPKNVVNVKQFELKTPDVTIKVNPDRRDLVSTQVIGGVEYILVRATEGVEVNGIAVKIN